MYINKKHKIIYNKNKDFPEKETYCVESFTETPFLGVSEKKPRYFYNENIAMKLYVCNFNKSDIDFNKPQKYKLFVKINNIEYTYILYSGYNHIEIINPGITGFYRITMYIMDLRGICSYRQYIPIQVIDENYEIKDSEIYYMTSDDLTNYNIDNTGNTDDTVADNNITGLNKLFSDVKALGYRKIIMLLGRYMLKTYFDRNHPVIIPSYFTVDLNGATLKQVYAGRCENTGPALMVQFQKNEYESHLINGTLEGEYDDHINHLEKPASGAIEGEAMNCIYSSLGYGSIENMNIGWNTGYTLCCNGTNLKYAPKDQKWCKGYIDDNGNLIDSDIFTSTDFEDITAIKNQSFKYQFGISCCFFRGYSNMVGDSLITLYRFYDENKNLIYTLKGSQYQHHEIPSNAVYLRVTFYTPFGIPKYTVRVDSGVINHNNEYKNIHFYDIRSCAMAIGNFDFCYIDNCTFTRCGQSCTPVPIDIEDGSKWARNLYFTNNEIDEFSKTQTGGIIVCYGHNIIMKSNKNFPTAVRGVIGLFVNQTSEHPCDLSIVKREHFRTGIVEIDNSETANLRVLNNHSNISTSYDNSIFNNIRLTNAIYVNNTDCSYYAKIINSKLSVNGSFNPINNISVIGSKFNNYTPSNPTGNWFVANSNFIGASVIKNSSKYMKMVFYKCHFEDATLRAENQKFIFIDCNFDNLSIILNATEKLIFNAVFKNCIINYKNSLVTLGPFAYTVNNYTSICFDSCELIKTTNTAKGLFYIQCTQAINLSMIKNCTLTQTTGYLIELNSYSDYTNTTQDIKLYISNTDTNGIKNFNKTVKGIDIIVN